MRVDRAVRQCAVVLALLCAATAPAAPAVAAPATVPAPPRAGALSGDEDQGPAEPEPVSEAARAAALAEPAIVVIEVQWEGYVRDRATAELLDNEPVSASTRCTGAGVGHEGYLLTTRSCLEQATVAREAFQQIVDRRVADGSTAESDAENLLTDLLADATIGIHPDDPPERSITVRRAVTNDEPMPASVVSVADRIDGDAALLKIARSNQPVLPLADDSDLAAGTELITMECPPEGDDVIGVAATTEPGDGGDAGPVRPQFRTGMVLEDSPRVVVEPTEQTEDTVALAAGVVLTHDAAIAGLVDASLPIGDVLVDLTVVRELLAEAEVDTGLGQVDRDYRAGLDAYYAGRYGDAIARFDTVLAIIPAHVQAHQYRDSAQGLRDAEGGGEPAPTDEALDRVESWLNGRSWSLVGVLVLVAIVVFLIHKRRPPAANPAVADAADPAVTGARRVAAADPDDADAAVPGTADPERTETSERAGQTRA